MPLQRYTAGHSTKIPQPSILADICVTWHLLKSGAVLLKDIERIFFYLLIKVDAYDWLLEQSLEQLYYKL